MISYSVLFICVAITAGVCSLVCFFAGVGAAYLLNRDEIAALTRRANELEELLEDAQDENPLWFVNRSYERN